MQAGFLIHDDLIDDSPMRRGKPSWGLSQQKEGRGLIGINDGLHLYMSVQQILMSALTNPQHSRCIEVIKLFGDCANATCFGQGLDILGDIGLNSSISNAVSEAKLSETHQDRLKNITLDRFALISRWKTAHYSFVLPVLAGMLLADVKNEALFSNAKSILFEIGEYFQAQDDYLDVYGDTSVTGKVGMDISDGKCSWIIATALEKASTDQRNILNSNYGIPDPGCVEAVRKVFDELDIPAIYSAYEDRTRVRILEMIDSMCTEETKDKGYFSNPDASKLPKKFFVELLNLFYRRAK
nr:farnesyl pyrophosphate synthase [Hymenolepis microstoma]